MANTDSTQDMTKPSSSTFLDDFPKRILTNNSYPLTILMPIFKSIKIRIENEAQGNSFGIAVKMRLVDQAKGFKND